MPLSNLCKVWNVIDTNFDDDLFLENMQYIWQLRMFLCSGFI